MFQVFAAFIENECSYKLHLDWPCAMALTKEKQQNI